jgi:NCAIR mutase (PurE)-related proteins
MDDIRTMWRKRLPVAVIATKHQIKRKDVIAELGDLYSKNEAHYRANEYRDAQRIANFSKWYDNQFDLAELQDAVNKGALQDYWRKIAKPEKLTVSAVRDFVTTKLGTLPERTTSRSRYEPETYKLGAKSAYFGREQELIDMWQVNQLSIEAISRKTGVSKRALSKLLKPRGYDSHQIRSQIAMERSKVRKQTKLTNLVKSVRENEDFTYWQEQVNNRQLGQAINERAKVHNVRPITFREVLYAERSDIREVVNGAKVSLVKNFVDNLTPEQIDEFRKSENRRVWIEQHKPLDIQSVNEIWRQLLLKYPNATADAWAKRQHVNVPTDYIGHIPDWIWSYVDKQDAVLLLDKLVSFCADYESIVGMLVDAERVTEHKISFAEIDRYLPVIDGISDWSRLIRQNFPNDDVLSYLTGGFSSYENQVYDVLQSLNVNFEVHNRSLGFELDFYLPELNLAIECSPLATHNSNKFTQEDAYFKAKTPNYHADKYKIARQNGIQLITLFEKHFVPDVWTNKTVPMLRRLVTGRADVTLYARQVDIRLMSRPEDKTLTDAFLERYHMEGKTPARIRYGLFYQNELVGVATFGLPATPSYKDGETLELKRLAFKSDTQVRYGISKVVARLTRDYPEYTRLMTYSNNNMGHGLGYKRAGFTFVKETGAQLTFVNPKDPLDTYSWSVATTWGAKSGVIAKLLGSQNVTSTEARRLVETKLPHRTDDGVGYVAFYDTGNKLWVKTLREKA